MAGQEVTQLLRVLLAVCLVTTPVPCFGQAAQQLEATQREELGRYFSRAQSAFEAKNYLEAIEALKAAHRILPEPNILYRIGDAFENLGDLEHAAEFYARYVAASPSASDAGLVKRRIVDLRRRAAELEERLKATEPERAALLLDSNPAGATVRLDEKSVEGQTPVRVELAPGRHHVELRRDGYVAVIRDIRLQPGETISLVYQLEKVAAAAEPVASRGPGAWPWVVGGTGLLSLGASVGFFLGARGADSTITAWDEERAEAYTLGAPVLERPAEYDQKVRDRVIFRNVGFAAGGVGAAALIGGVVWLILAGGDEPNAVALSLGPAGGAVRVTF